MMPPSLLQRLLMGCLMILLAVLALQYASSILQRIWPTLAVSAGVVLAAIGMITILRWRRNRW